MLHKRLLLINPNTTAAVTERFVAEARFVAPAGTIIDGITASDGPAIVTTPAENEAAGRVLLEMLDAHWQGYDAVILAISFDSQLAAARRLAPVPVIGVTEASFHAAALRGEPFGLLTYGMPSRPLYEMLVRHYGWADQVVGIQTLEADTAAHYLSPSPDLAAVAIERLAALGARTIVICGAAFAGMARRWQPRTQVRLIDACEPAVRVVFDHLARGSDPR